MYIFKGSVWVFGRVEKFPKLLVMYFNTFYEVEGHQVCTIQVFTISQNFKENFIEYGSVQGNKSKETKISL